MTVHAHYDEISPHAARYGKARRDTDLTLPWVRKVRRAPSDAYREPDATDDDGAADRAADRTDMRSVIDPPRDGGPALMNGSMNAYVNGHVGGHVGGLADGGPHAASPERPRGGVMTADGVPRTRPASIGLYRAGMKRAFDIVMILLALPVTLPLVGALALLIALNGGHPFYQQERIGRGGRIYRMWKLRSMVLHADTHLETHLDANPGLREEWDSKQKLMDDPRITPMGRFLRKSSIDELPQLLNVLTGDMSLVGPRPMMVSQQPLYPGTDYYQLRPGITGFWQISDRNQTTFADRAGYDARYNRDLSLRTDLRILAATVRVVLRGTGH